MQLTIVIPTYNRHKDLKKNLDLLEDQIVNSQLTNDIIVLVSDNCSTDGTYAMLAEKKKASRISLILYHQDLNLGYEQNILFSLSKVATEWVMLLGDDDYLEPTYISDCINAIKTNPSLGCIIANYREWNPVKKELGALREENCPTEYHKAGFNACLKNAWRAHQLSGLTFRREGLYEEYNKRKLHNLYPQIFFVAYTALRYDVIHFGHFCLRVSNIPQTQKDWNYGDDRLMNDILDNFKNLGLPYKKRAELESYFNLKQKRYYWASCNNQGILIDNILSAVNLSTLGRYYIARQILKDQCYTGKKYRLLMYGLARFVLLKNLLTGKAIRF